MKVSKLHQGHRKAQQYYGTSKKAEYWLETIVSDRLTQSMQLMIGKQKFFFIATSSKDGSPNLNYKGGEEGILQVINEQRIVYPEIEGNGILHGIGDLFENNQVAMLIIDFNRKQRIKLSGKATVVNENIAAHPYAALFSNYTFHSLVIVDIDCVMPNCSKYIQNS
jgi:predicted pyridoxine 5'-phosphate oxidase superfamily flavin-nucleotide-binding protein